MLVPGSSGTKVYRIDPPALATGLPLGDGDDKSGGQRQTGDDRFSVSSANGNIAVGFYSEAAASSSSSSSTAQQRSGGCVIV